MKNRVEVRLHRWTQIHADESQRQFDVEDNKCPICISLRGEDESSLRERGYPGVSVAKDYIGSKA